MCLHERANYKHKHHVEKQGSRTVTCPTYRVPDMPPLSIPNDNSEGFRMTEPHQCACLFIQWQQITTNNLLALISNRVVGIFVQNWMKHFIVSVFILCILLWALEAFQKHVAFFI